MTSKVFCTECKRKYCAKHEEVRVFYIIGVSEWEGTQLLVGALTHYIELFIDNRCEIVNFHCRALVGKNTFKYPICNVFFSSSRHMKTSIKDIEP